MKKDTVTPNELTQTKPQETIKGDLKKHIGFFAFGPPINFSEEKKWLVAVTNFEENNSGFNRTDENYSFLTSTQNH